MRFARKMAPETLAGRSGARSAPTGTCVPAEHGLELCLRTAAALVAAAAALALGPADGLGATRAAAARGSPPDTTPGPPVSGGSPAPAANGDLPRAPRPGPPDSTAADGPPDLALPERPWEGWARDAAAVASLLTLDRPVRTAAQEMRSDATGESAVARVADRAEWFGDWESSLPWIVGGSLAVGQLTGGYDGLGEAGALLAGGAAASMANEALNRAVGRGRPSWEEGAFSVDPFRGHASFPSGHTAYVFGVASGIDVVTDGPVPAVAAYGVAGLTGLSRIYHDRHWLTDVVASAALSTVVSRLATGQALRVLGIRGDGGSARDAGRGDGAAESPGGTPGSAGLAAGRGREAGGTAGPRFEPLLAPSALGVRVRF